MRALFPATFDPVTNGHVDILTRAARTFESLVAAVYDDGDNNTLFSVDERLELLSTVVRDLPNVDVRPYSGITVNFAREVGAGVLLRGLRAISDFEHEFAYSAMNRRLDPGIDVLCYLSAPEHAFVSSSLVREIGALGRSVAEFVPTNVASAVAAKFAPDEGRR